ncbi:hypothetical protein B0T22DRAFT_451724 [Podospora appendiculata]|uniref:Secreted protein n=1 Tax=Podospora appendiculata TaxID=314037 RepID=A0AAE0XJ38_9PEZI|nr:hypothetical protein B0T22DRAFT_451724 [Podospora appendiculata]
MPCGRRLVAILVFLNQTSVRATHTPRQCTGLCLPPSCVALVSSRLSNLHLEMLTWPSDWTGFEPKGLIGSLSAVTRKHFLGIQRCISWHGMGRL